MTRGKSRWYLIHPAERWEKDVPIIEPLTQHANRLAWDIVEELHEDAVWCRFTPYQNQPNFWIIFMDFPAGEDPNAVQ